MALAREMRRRTSANFAGDLARAPRCELPVARRTRALLRLRRWVQCNPGILVVALAASEAVLILCLLELVVV